MSIKKSAETAKKENLGTKEKKATKRFELVVKIPSDVEAKIENGVLAISKGKTTLKRRFSRPRISLEIKKINDEKAVVLSLESERKKERAIVGTWSSHIKNMVEGVTSGYQYKLRIIYSHFPVTVKIVGNEVQVNNFMGERGIRKAAIVGDSKVEAQKDTIIIRGPNKEDVGTTAANLERATHLARFDRRRFPDGIYLEK